MKTKMDRTAITSCAKNMQHRENKNAYFLFQREHKTKPHRKKIINSSMHNGFDFALLKACEHYSCASVFKVLSQAS